MNPSQLEPQPHPTTHGKEFARPYERAVEGSKGYNAESESTVNSCANGASSIQPSPDEATWEDSEETGEYSGLETIPPDPDSNPLTRMGSASSLETDSNSGTLVGGLPCLNGYGERGKTLLSLSTGAEK